MEYLNNIQWRSGQEISTIEKNQIIYFLGANFTCQQIASALNRDKRTVQKWITRYQNT